MFDRRLRTTFGNIPEGYDFGRPDYPEELISDIIELSSLTQHSNLLEIGPGTGKATLPFAARGYHLTALEPSVGLLRTCQENLAQYKNVEYIQGLFESADLPPESFDLVFAAQSFHWVDPNIGYKKVHGILKQGGHLAIFANHPCNDAALEEKVIALYKKHCPKYPGNYGTLAELQVRFEESGLFGDITKRNYVRNLEYSRERYLKLINTFSWILCLQEPERGAFFGELNSVLGNTTKLSVPFESVLLLGRKK